MCPITLTGEAAADCTARTHTLTCTTRYVDAVSIPPGSVITIVEDLSYANQPDCF